MARVVIAPDKFKGSCDAAGVAAALCAGVRDVWGDGHEYVNVPMADGGDGTVQAFLSTGAWSQSAIVTGPLGSPVTATYARDGDTAIIEVAAASGLTLLDGELDARRASTFGTGELLRDALDNDAKHIILGIGGSATTDGGAGALAALGVRFLDSGGNTLDPNPQALANVASIDISGLDPRVHSASIEIACDVDNPLLGPSGAATIYGPQKGANASDIVFLDGMLAHMADVAVQATGMDLRGLPGAGAAGGLGWGLATFAGARLAPGFDLIARQRHLASVLAGAALCITGEGRIDEQTLHGKVVAGIAHLARPLGIPVVAFGGSVVASAQEALAAVGVTCVPMLDVPTPLEVAMRTAPILLRAAAARYARDNPLP